MESPVTFSVDTPDRIANWRPLVQWLMAVPHFFVLYALGIASGVLGFLCFFSVLFTKRIPDGVFGAQAMIMRYQNRVVTYAAFLHDSYPPFTFDAVAEDPGGSPAVLSYAPPGEMSRFKPLIKWLLVIPHYFVLFFVGIGAFFAWTVAFFSVLFTGRYPAGMQNYMVGVARWSLRVSAYVYFMTDVYPPFSFQ